MSKNNNKYKMIYKLLRFKFPIQLKLIKKLNRVVIVSYNLLKEIKQITLVLKMNMEQVMKFNSKNKLMSSYKYKMKKNKIKNK